MTIYISDKSEEIRNMYYDRYSSKYNIIFDESENYDLIISEISPKQNKENKIYLLPLSQIHNNNQNNIIYFKDLNDLNKILYQYLYYFPRDEIWPSLYKHKYDNYHLLSNTIYFTFDKLFENIKSLSLPNEQKDKIKLILNEIGTKNSMIKILVKNNLINIIVNFITNKYLYFTHKFTSNFYIINDIFYSQIKF